MRRVVFWCCVLVGAMGCADIESDGLTQTDEAERGGYKNGSGLPAGGILGADCTDGCLWSSWAVSIGVQRASHDCGGAPCACVQEGAASLTCTPNGSTGGGGGSSGQGGTLGSTCSPGCLWSGFAVSIGAQSAKATCSGFAPCACVQDGNIYSLCEPGTVTNASSGGSPEPVTVVSQKSVGDSCGTGCIWSGFAVTIGAQTSNDTCEGVPCACVSSGNVFAACSGSASTSSGTSSGTTNTPPPSPTAASTPAGRILDRHNGSRLTLWNQSFGRYDGADPLSNIRDAVAGRRAKTSCYGRAPCQNVFLTNALLSGMDRLTDEFGYGYFVTSIAGAEHSYGSKHYQGRAFDIDEINGQRIYGDSQLARQFMAACRQLGASEVFGPSNDPYGHSDHIHCAW